jgi:ribosomal protein L32
MFNLVLQKLIFNYKFKLVASKILAFAVPKQKTPSSVKRTRNSGKFLRNRILSKCFLCNNLKLHGFLCANCLSKTKEKTNKMDL